MRRPQDLSRILIVSVAVTFLAISGGMAGDIVVPCPDGEVDSSGDITEALLSIGPYETVYLEECTYFLSGPVDVPTAFRGTLKGVGQDKTTLITLDDTDGIEDVFLVNWKSFDPAGWPGPTLFHFYSPPGMASDITISDLTIEVSDPEPAHGSVLAGWFGGALLAIVTVEGKTVDTHFDRLTLIGGEGNFLGYNSIYGIEMWGEIGVVNPDGAMEGQHKLQGSTIESVGFSYNVAALSNGEVIALKNTMVNQSTAFTISFTYENATIQLKQNQISGVGSRAIDLGFGGRYHIEKNEIELPNEGEGVGIFINQGAVSAKVSQNVLRGTGFAGIQAAGGSGHKIIKGDYSGFSPTSGFSIVLDVDTSDCLVVGVPAGSVLDLGTGNRIVAEK